MLNTWLGICSPSGHHNPHSRGAESSPRTTVCKPLTCNIDRGTARFSRCVAWHAKWKTCHHQWVTGHLKWAFPREVTAPTHCASLIFLIHLLRSVTVWLSHSTYITNMNVTYVGPGTNKRGGEGFFCIFYSRGNIILYTLMVFDIVHSLLSEQDSCSVLPSTITDDPRFYLWGTFCNIVTTSQGMLLEWFAATRSSFRVYLKDCLHFKFSLENPFVLILVHLRRAG